MEHPALRPGWRCRTCGVEWPCESAKSLLRVYFTDDRQGLAIYMVDKMLEAVADLNRLNPDDGPRPEHLYSRFIAWTRRGVPGLSPNYGHFDQ